MMRRVRTLSNFRDGYTIDNCMTWIRKTMSFNHISDSALRGWFLGIARIDMFGQHTKTKHTNASTKIIECTKCDGKTWFGRGRKVCSQCNGSGKEVKLIPAKISKDYSRITGSMNRSWRALVDDCSGKDKYLCILAKNMDRHVTVKPEWIDFVKFPDFLSKAKISQAKQCLMDGLTQRIYSPSIRGVHQLFHITEPRIRFDLQACLVRLALTFGCTCPITGEYVTREDVRQYNRECEGIYPLGFCVGLRESKSDNEWISPLSRSGRKAIIAAENRCMKALGKYNNDWVLAELMKTHLLRNATA